MTALRLARDRELSAAELAALRRLADEAFGDRFSDEDWAHSFGGVRVLLDDADRTVAQAAVVPRRIQVEDRDWRAGYVEAVATAPDRQGEGLGSRVMRVVGEVVDRDFELGVLSTGAHDFYARLGWERWAGPSFVQVAGRLTRTADEDDGLMVLRTAVTAAIDPTARIVCDGRDGDDW